MKVTKMEPFARLGNGETTTATFDCGCKAAFRRTATGVGILPKRFFRCTKDVGREPDVVVESMEEAMRDHMSDQPTPRPKWRWMDGNTLLQDSGHRQAILAARELRTCDADGRLVLLDPEMQVARWIVAAPEMLDALEDVAAEVRTIREQSDAMSTWSAADWRRWFEQDFEAIVVSKARAAIALARVR